MTGPKEQGGLDMPDFDIINNGLKATWVKRLNDSTELKLEAHTPLLPSGRRRFVPPPM